MLQASSTEVHLGWVATPLGNPPVPLVPQRPRPPLICWPPKFLLPPDFPQLNRNLFQMPPDSPVSLLLSMLLEHKLRAENSPFRPRSGNDRPAVEPAQLATCFCTAQRARKEFYIFKRLGKVRGIIFGGTRSFYEIQMFMSRSKVWLAPCHTSHSLYVWAGRFFTTAARLSSCFRDTRMGHLNLTSLLSDPSQRKLDSCLKLSAEPQRGA